MTSTVKVEGGKTITLPVRVVWKSSDEKSKHGVYNNESQMVAIRCDQMNVDEFLEFAKEVKRVRDA